MKDSKSHLQIASEVFFQGAIKKIEALLNAKKNIAGYEADLEKILVDGLGELRGSGTKILQQLALEETDFDKVSLKSLAFSNNRAMSFPLVDKVLRKSIGLALYQNIHLDKDALASASIGQVHRGSLSGVDRDLVFKVQYPGVKSNIEKETLVLRGILKFVTNPLLKGTFLEILDSLAKETDYTNELAINSQFHEYSFTTGNIIIPEPEDQLCRDNVLVQEYLAGSPLSDFLQKGELPPTKSLENILAFVFESLFELNAVYSDPHPGNFIVLNERPETIGVVDFGAVKQGLSNKDIELIHHMLHPRRDYKKLHEMYVACGMQKSLPVETFKENIVSPFVEVFDKILHQESVDVWRHQEEIKSLRKILFYQAGVPELKGLSYSFTLVHKALINLLLTLSKFRMPMNTQLKWWSDSI